MKFTLKRMKELNLKGYSFDKYDNQYLREFRKMFYSAFNDYQTFINSTDSLKPVQNLTMSEFIELYKEFINNNRHIKFEIANFENYLSILNLNSMLHFGKNITGLNNNKKQSMTAHQFFTQSLSLLFTEFKENKNVYMLYFDKENCKNENDFLKAIFNPVEDSMLYEAYLNYLHTLFVVDEKINKQSYVDTRDIEWPSEIEFVTKRKQLRDEINILLKKKDEINKIYQTFNNLKNYKKIQEKIFNNLNESEIEQ